MMSQGKSRWILLGFLLLSLAGCGEKKGDATSAAVSPEQAASAVEGGAGNNDGDDGGDGGGLGLFPRDEFLRYWTESCVQSVPFMNPGAKLETQKLESYCGCVTEDLFGGMSNARLEEWLKDWEKRRVMLEKVVEDRNYKPSPAEQAELDRGNREWAEVYTRSENACMQKAGVSLRHTYGNS